jgi:hypothetical protein
MPNVSRYKVTVTVDDLVTRSTVYQITKNVELPWEVGAMMRHEGVSLQEQTWAMDQNWPRNSELTYNEARTLEQHRATPTVVVDDVAPDPALHINAPPQVWDPALRPDVGRGDPDDFDYSAMHTNAPPVVDPDFKTFTNAEAEPFIADLAAMPPTIDERNAHE